MTYFGTCLENFDRSATAIEQNSPGFFQKDLYGSHILRRHVGEGAHVHGDGVPLSRRELRAGPSVMALSTVHGP
jgi:hypothetical protein